MAPSGHQTVWLGLPGDLIDPSEVLGHVATKAGGAPLYPGRRPPLAEGDVKCRACGKPLSLVLQAYAPAEGLDDRCILIFGCTAEACGRKPGSWRAWRCQLPPSATPAAAPAPATAPAAPPAAAAAPPAPAAAAFSFESGGDAWGLGSSGGGGGGGAFDLGGFPAGGSAFGGDNSSGGAFDFSDLTSAVEQAATDLSTAARKGKAAKRAEAAAAAAEAGQGEGGAGGAPSSVGSAGARLPEFHMYAEEEPAEAAVPEKELEHARQLLARYQQEPAAGGDRDGPAAAAVAPTAGAAASSSGGSSGGAQRGGKGTEEPEGPEAWAGEGYEPTQLRGVVRSYVKWSKRVARQPQQCARYCPGAAPLWPDPDPPRPEPCAACGAPRSFELQLMPALIQMLVEAGEMERAGSSDGPVLSAVSQWDWCTIAVLACSANCSSGGSSGKDACVCLEEQVAIVNESDLHTIPPGASGAGAAAAAAAGIVL